MKTSFKTRGLRMVRQFCGCQYFNYEIFVSSYSPFFSNLSNQNLQNVKSPKRKLKGFVERYSFKFRAQVYLHTVVLYDLLGPGTSVMFRGTPCTCHLLCYVHHTCLLIEGYWQEHSNWTERAYA